MRHIMMTMVLMLVSMTASAQNVQKLNERYFQAKVREMTMRLGMTHEQKAKFVPLYRQYNEEMRAIVGTRQKPRKPMSDDERLAMMKRKMERQQQAQSIRMRYVDKFAKILTSEQVARFFEVENEIQQKLMLRRQQHR